MGINLGLYFTPLESPASCPVRSSASIGAYREDEPRKLSGLLRVEDWIPLGVNMGFKAPCERFRWKVEDFLTGFNEKKA